MTRPRRRRALLTAIGAVTVLAGCATGPGVHTLDASQSDRDPAPPPASSVPDDPTATTAPVESVPMETVPGRADQLLNFGDEKQPRPYDEFLVAALNDVEVWWGTVYPEIYGEPFEPLAGGIYAGYPERTSPIPPCGQGSETPYDELIFYAAFYCPLGDFMAYDDGEQGLLYQLAEAFGPSVMGVVLAHEYGHAIQERSGVLEQGVPTIYTEQQADCFSGAWMAHAVRGEAPGVELTDADIRAGLIALIRVRDPLGINQLTPGGHGSGFDRVGAFQVGYKDGPVRCAELIENPLPLMPNEFVNIDLTNDLDGNADFGYEDEQIAFFVTQDLNEYWTSVLGGTADPFTEITLQPFGDPGEVSCDEELVGDPDVGTLWCRSSRTVFIDDPLARQRYDEMGDFAIGYMLGTAWSEAAQESFNSPLDGEDRALINDCLTGSWTKTLIPDDNGRTARGALIEPGDLDEAIQTALVIGDPQTDDDVLGSPFEKIDSFRAGVLGGVDSCQQIIDDD